MSSSFIVSGQLVDIHLREIYPAKVVVTNGKIQSIERVPVAPDQYLLPGFVDAHIHIESSMLVPTEFARIAVIHGTVATVSDPHEIANVCGVAGVHYMIDNARQSPLKFNFGAPSCVPATMFETAGASIDSEAIAALMALEEIKYLAEVMNFPGVLAADKEVMAKIAAAKAVNKPVDGHAPGLRGSEAARYAAAGIATDHECTTLDEALDKVNAGMHILIREGSAAKNFDALIGLLRTQPNKVMFCSDDKHPDELMKGHINDLVIKALSLGYDIFDVLKAACVTPVYHYQLDVGLLRVGDPADFIVAGNLEDFNVLQTYIDGTLVADKGQSCLPAVPVSPINNFAATKKMPADFALLADKESSPVHCRVIDALDGQLLTTASAAVLKVVDYAIQPDPEQDILKIGVVNRYHQAPVSLGFIRNFGLKKGALASSVAHDSHNIVFVGADDNSICEAVNAIIGVKGGISAYDGDGVSVLPLPVAGLMTMVDAATTAMRYEELDGMVKQLGSQLRAPFMTLSFMALPVIPYLKLTDKGLFDVGTFKYVDLLFNAQEHT